MRGGFLHNRVLVERLVERFQEAGADTQCEVAVRFGTAIVFVDLLAEWPNRRIVVEVEQSTKRITQDLNKAMTLDTDELWIVVPTTLVREAILRRLARMCIRTNQGCLFVLTLGQALQRVSDFLPRFAGA